MSDDQPKRFTRAGRELPPMPPLPPVRYPPNPSPSAWIGRWIIGLVQRLRGG